MRKPKGPKASTEPGIQVHSHRKTAGSAQKAESKSSISGSVRELPWNRLEGILPAEPKLLLAMRRPRILPCWRFGVGF